MQEKVRRNFSRNNNFILIGIYTSLLIILFSSLANPQIPINGFCKYNAYQIKSQYNSLYAVNYNSDSYADLLLYNNQRKEILQIEGSSSGVFEKQMFYSVPYEINKVVRLSDKKNTTLGYAFTSRKGMSVGIFKFLKNGKPVLSRKIKFKSYPENICAADIDKDNQPELMVSGGSFEGLAVLHDKKGTLQETYIEKKDSYTGAIFIDLTNDGTPDIAAYNLIGGSLDFFYNDGKGSFRKERSFNFSEKVYAFKVFDLNLDSYQDLMFISGRSIYIMYGDFRSSYEKRTILETKYQPDSFVIGDYNRDGRIDLIYLNKSKSIISALFAVNKSSFYPEIIMLRKPELSNLITYYSKFIGGIAAVSEDGFIYTITRLSSIADDTGISIGGKPSVINYFDYENDGIYDLCFIDEFDNSLKLMVRNNAGIPSLFYSYTLFGLHSKILVDDVSESIKTFYCYKPGSRLIEKFKIDFINNKLQREEIYSPGNLIDFKIERRDTGKYSFYILYEKSKAFGFSVFTKAGEFTFNENFENIAFNISNAAISTTNNIAFFYWKVSKDSLVLTKKVLPRKRKINDSKEPADIAQLVTFKKINIIPPFPAGNELITTFIGDIFNNKKEVCISFITDVSGLTDTNKENAAIIAAPKTLNILRNTNFSVTDDNQIFFGEMKFNGSKNLFIYSPEEKMLSKLDFIERSGRYVLSPVADSVDINHYFIKNMSMRNYHLVFTDKKSGCISIRKIG
jgi:hypothetical protein